MSRLIVRQPGRMAALVVALIVAGWADAAFAISFGGPGGKWPKTWPAELEPLRKQAWTWEHGLIMRTNYAIPFTDRKQFEAAWPHILKVKGKGASITLLRGAHVRVKGAKTAGVNIFPPLKHAKGPVALTRIELVVDGKIVDLNRIRLPDDTPIIDKRFPKPVPAKKVERVVKPKADATPGAAGKPPVAPVRPAAPRVQSGPVSSYAATLQKHGIKPDTTSLRSYLQQIARGAAQRRELRRLVEQLGSDRFADRESAMKRLLSLPNPPVTALQKAARSDDAEVRWRARKILEGTKSMRSQRQALLHAVLKTIAQAKTPGLTAELLNIVDACDQRYLQLALQAALRTSARRDDAPLLRKATQSEDEEVAIAAIGGLRAVLGLAARDDLRRLMQHKHEEVSLAAARALTDLGDRTSLRRLVQLLDAVSLQVRIGAVRTLRQATGTRHDYLAYQAAAVRRDAVARWSAWVAENGRTAKLHFPLDQTRLALGRTLIAIGRQNKVIELDAAGKQIWEQTKLKGAWGCQGLPNGHRLVSTRDGRSLIEYNADGKEVWRKDGLPSNVCNARRLDNGNTLVAIYQSHKVLEFRPDGSTAWEMAINGGPTDVQRLDDGRTLVTLFDRNRVIEIDRAGKVHWELTGLKNPLTAQRLDNGNTLIAEYNGGRVAEHDRSGAIVWQQSGLQHPYSGQRLPGGNTLIAHQTDVREVDGQGKLIWHKPMTGVWHASRY